VATLDVRAGATLGRIYRIYPAGREPRPIPRLDRLDTAGLVHGLDSPNGWQRDLVQQMLVWKSDAAAVPLLRRLARDCPRPVARLHAQNTLAALNALDAHTLTAALSDGDSGVRRHAVRLAEPQLASAPAVADAMLKLVGDADPQVQLQLAYTLGEWADPRAGTALARLALRHAADPYLTNAVLSSVNGANLDAVLAGVIDAKVPAAESVQAALLGLAAAIGTERSLGRVLELATVDRAGEPAARALTRLAAVLDALERRRTPLDALVRGPTRPQVEARFAAARQIAARPGASEADLCAALRVLGRGLDAIDADLDTIAQQLAPRQSAAVQAAAVEALARSNSPRVPELLLAGWPSHTPALRGQILDVLLSRDATARVLLARMERGAVARADVDATRRERLLRHRDATLRHAAEKLFAGATMPDRASVIAVHRDVAKLPGDPARGKAVFAKTCAPCHKLDGTGHPVGPDLAALPNRSPDALLVSLLDASRNVDQRYVQYLVATRDGRSFSGMLGSETGSSITLRGQEGKEQVILRSDIEELQNTGKSLMPDGLERDLSRQELADVIAYVARSGRPPKPFDGNRPQVVRASADGSLALRATHAEIYGDQIVFEPPFRNIGCWHGERDHVIWTVEVEKTGRFDVYLDWACHDDAAGSSFVIDGFDVPLRGQVAGTRGWDRYRQGKLGTVQLAAGAHRVLFRPDGPLAHGALLDLRTLLLVPAGADARAALVAARIPAPAADDPVPDPAAPYTGHESAEALARQILDRTKPDPVRVTIASSRPDIPAELVAALTRDLEPGTEEEYRRIPWIWRVAVATGKRNDAVQIRRLLEVSLPPADQPLHDWQAVVIGGGIINGISQTGTWPGDRIGEIVKGDAALAARWHRALERASPMADNPKTPTGTRYDALRMLGVEPWDRRGAQLVQYLAKGTHGELQMGAISGLSDMRSPQVAPALLAGVEHYSTQNRALAFDALLRDDSRAAALKAALDSGRLSAADVGPARLDALRKRLGNPR
jgi:putative heme-binding domain-containing protein